MAVTYRLLQEGEEPEVLALFTRTFGGEMSLEHYKWKYRSIPDVPTVEAVAVDDELPDGEQIVAFYGLQGARFDHPSGEEFLSFQETDLMVDPRTQGKGVFLSLNQFAYEQVREHGGAFNYGFPNQNSAPIGVKKFGWTFLGRVPVWSGYFRLVSSRKKWMNVLGKFAFRLPGYNLVRKAALKVNDDHLALVKVLKPNNPTLPSLFQQDWSTPGSKGKLGTKRTPEFLKWRYLDCPDREYTYLHFEHKGLRGLAVLTKGRPHGFEEWSLVDAYATEMATLRLLVVRAMMVAFEAKSSVIRCWALPHTELAKVLGQCGLQAKDGAAYVTFTFDERANSKTIDTPEEWHVTLGDSDVL